MRLDAGIDDQRSRATPVLLLGEGADTINVRGWVGTRERDPEEIIQAAGGEVAVIDDDDEGKRGRVNRLTKAKDLRSIRVRSPECGVRSARARFYPAFHIPHSTLRS